MTVIQFRRDTPAKWLAADPVLDEGEPGYEIGTGRLKVGDGVSRWSDLEYFTPVHADGTPVSDEVLEEHINSPEPHPIYDDGPSLALLYLNAKV